MAVALSTIGATISWAKETTAGTRPTTGYTKLTGITSIAEIDSDPETADVTPLGELEYKQYISLLKDTGGITSLGCNVTDEFMTAWDATVTASASANIWYAVEIQGLTKAFFFQGTPSELGLAEVAVNTAYQGTAKITTNLIEGWGTAPTVSE